MHKCIEWSRCTNFHAIFARSQRRPDNQIKWIIAEIYDGIHTYAYIYIQYNSFESTPDRFLIYFPQQSMSIVMIIIIDILLTGCKNFLPMRKLNILYNLSK